MTTTSSRKIVVPRSGNFEHPQTCEGLVRRILGSETISAADRAMTITDLSQAAGCTPRTLRHYEEVGLLSPRRTQQRTRIYDRDDALRVFAIVRLRRAGLSLESILASFRDTQEAALLEALHHCRKEALDRLNAVDHAIVNLLVQQAT